MKNKCNVPLVRLFGIIAIVAIIGFSMAACGDGDNGGGGGGDGGSNSGGGDPRPHTITFQFVGFGDEQLDIYLYRDGGRDKVNPQANGTYKVDGGTIYFYLTPLGNTNDYNHENITVKLNGTMTFVTYNIEVSPYDTYMYLANDQYAQNFQPLLLNHWVYAFPAENFGSASTITVTKNS
jgi:hypothetical protein